MATSNNQLTISNSLSQGWQHAKNNYSVLILCFLILAGISTAFSIFRSVPGIITSFTGDSSSAGLAVFVIFALLSPLLFVAETALQNLTAIGFTKIQLNILDSKKTRVSDLFNANGIFWQYLATSILVGLIVLGGLLLLIIPGIIWLLKYQFAMPLVVDKKLDITESIRKSGEITQGHKGWLFGFAIVLGLVNIAGALLLLVGLLVTIPLTTMAYIYVYRQLSSSVKASKN